MSTPLPIAGRSSDTQASEPSVRFRQLSLGSFVAVLYAYCAAGPFGFEEMVSTSGPGMALLFLLLVPWLFSVPVSLATAELATTMPVEGGFYRWTRAAFGNWWGFQCGWWNWTGTFLMNAAYAAAIADYVAGLFPRVSPVEHWLLSLIPLALVAYLNIRGTRVVGKSTVILLLLVLIPVAILVALGSYGARQNPFVPFVPPGRSMREIFGVGFALALWVYSGYEQLSTMTEEIERPRRNFPLGLTIMVPLAIVTFALPFLAGLASYGHWQEWKTGYMVVLARQLGGHWLEVSMFSAAGLSLFLGMQSTLLSGSRLPFTMSEDGFFHPGLAKLDPRFRTPVRAILLSTILCAALVVLRVAELVAIYTWFRVATTGLTLLSLWRLRKTAPDLPRPFRVPGGNLGLAAVVFVPLILFSWALLNSPWQALIWGPSSLALGPLAFVLFGRHVKP